MVSPGSTKPASSEYIPSGQPGDRRQVFCRLTRAGTAVVRSLDRPVDALDESMFAALSARERRDLIRLLDKLRNGLNEPE